MRLLIVEDHEPVLQSLKQDLERDGIAVDIARDCEDGEYMAQTTDYDAIVLDLALPREGGLSLLQRWRRSGLTQRIPVLTWSRGGSQTIPWPRRFVEGAHPAEPEGTLGRLRTIIRRSRPLPQPVLRIHDLEIDTRARSVQRAGRKIRLTPREFALLQLLAINRGQVVSRAQVWKLLYCDREERSSNVVDVYIRYLRNKIDKGFDPPLILTHWGKGYMLRGESASEPLGA